MCRPSTPDPAWVAGQPLFSKIGRLSHMHVEIGVNLPLIWPSAALATKWAPICKKPYTPFGSPPEQGRKKCGLSQQRYFRPFLGPTGVLSAVFALLGIFRSWHTIRRFQPCTPRALNAAWAAGNTFMLPLFKKNWPIHGIYVHIHRYRGHIQQCSPHRRSSPRFLRQEPRMSVERPDVARSGLARV